MKRSYVLFLQILFSLWLFGQANQTQLTNLPTFYINTLNSEPVIIKDTYLKGKLTIVSTDVTEAFADSLEIKGRGNSTWTMPKKPYRIKLNKKASLLNRPAKEKSWVLLANYCDKTLMRNAVAFKISELVGLEFTPTARFVDVVLNDQFLGNYMLSDQMEVAKGRVDVETQKTTDITEPNITGGYLLEIDGFASSEPKYFVTNRKMPITVKYPKDDEINEAQFNYISNYTKNFENILFSNNFTDPTAGYRAYVDENSLINWYIASEFTGNSDSFWSTYIYKKRNDPKFYFGPMWDYDIAFNNDYRLGDATKKLMREYAHDPKTWIKRFWEDPWFQNAVRARWKQLVDNGIETTILNYIDETSQLLQQSQQQNFNKWNILDMVVYREVYTFPTYDQGVDYLKSYISNRIAYLNNGFVADNQQPVKTPFVPETNAYYNIVNKRSGNAVDLSNEANTDGTKLILTTVENGKKSQQWRMNDIGNGNYTIVNRENSKAIKATGVLGASIYADVLSSSNSFAWEFPTTNLDDYYGVINQNTGFGFNNAGGSIISGNSLIEWNSNINTSDNSKFRFTKLVETGIDTFAPDSRIVEVLYNPGTQFVKLANKNFSNSSVSIEIYSMNGSKLLSNKYYDTKSELNVGAMANGVYLVRVQSGEQSYVGKFVKY